MMINILPITQILHKNQFSCFFVKRYVCLVSFHKEMAEIYNINIVSWNILLRTDKYEA